MKQHLAHGTSIAKAVAFAAAAWAWHTAFVLLGRASRPRAQRLEFSGHDRVVVVAPHPDDETIGCAGTIALHALHGDATFVLVVTDGSGSRGAGALTPREMGSRRAGELARATGVLGTQAVALAIPEDEFSTNRIELPVAHALSALEPTIVYAPSGVDYHPHHVATARVLARLLSGAHMEVRVYETLVPLTPILVNRVAHTASVEDAVAEARRQYVSQELTVGRGIRLGQQRRALWQAPGPIEVFWSLTPAQYRAVMNAHGVASFRGLRDRPFGDGLSWITGMRARRRLRAIARRSASATE